MADKFDFIVVGGGTAGALLASRLSNATTRPNVLLVETGGNGLPADRRPVYLRYRNIELPELDFGYSTVPQPALGGQQLPYARGNGLGGSSMTNFMAYTRGPAADYDRWADLVGDRDWSWESSKERFRQIETFHDDIDAGLRMYVNPSKNNHGYNGGLHVSVPEKKLENEIKLVMDASQELGWSRNLDVNSGDVMGISIVASSSRDGQRSTSEKAFLHDQPGNLIIWTSSQVSKVLFDGKIAVGIETVAGKKAYASKEVIITAGSIDSPKLLLLSGIGPARETEELGIESVYDLPAVGKNARDHVLIGISHLMDQSFSARTQFDLDSDRQAAASEEWNANHTGPLSFVLSGNVIVFLKDDSIYDTDAFKSLDEETRRYLERTDVPHFEMITGSSLTPPDYPMTSDLSYSQSSCFVMNPQSQGSVTLRSKDPLDKPLIDLQYLTHPYDSHSMMAAVRAEQKLMKTKIMSDHYKGSILVPKSESDEDTLAFIKQGAKPAWHISCTAKMGKTNDGTAVVDSDMKVFGVQHLRVADLSVCPLLVNAHTQAVAYLIGQTAADKIIAEHHL